MKCFNSFDEMFNAQSGLKSDMSVFNTVTDNPGTKSFIVKDKDGDAVAEVFYDVDVSRIPVTDNGEPLEGVPLVGINHWSKFYGSLGYSDSRRFEVDIMNYCEDHFGIIAGMDDENSETICGFDKAFLTKEQAEKLARHIDINVNEHGSFYLI